MNGIIIIDKPAGYTSRDIVNLVSKKFETKKIGHTGTLDPMATGVLVLTVNSATKISELLTNYNKEYIAEITLGILTDTLDITGNVMKKEKAIKTKIEIINVLKEMLGTYDQEVPLYSAVKVKGKKLYEYARKKEIVDLPKHQVTIYNLELIDDVKYERDTTIFKIKCLVSKGTYIRSLSRDLANKLGTIGVMSSLRRTKQGEFHIKQAIPLEEIDSSHIISITDALKNYPQVVADDYLKRKLKDGQIIDNIYNTDKVLFVDENNQALCLYQSYGNNKLKPWKMFNYR